MQCNKRGFKEILNSIRDTSLIHITYSLLFTYLHSQTIYTPISDVNLYCNEDLNGL